MSALDSFKNNVRKGEIAHNEQFLLFPTMFSTFLEYLCNIDQISNCLLQVLSLGRV